MEAMVDFPAYVPFHYNRSRPFRGVTDTQFLHQPYPWASLAIRAAGVCILIAVFALMGSDLGLIFSIMAPCIAGTIASSIVAIYMFIAQKLHLYNERKRSEITDPDQIKILKLFPQKAQECIKQARLFEPSTTHHKWGVAQLQFFNPMELQHLLDHFGPQFSILDFEGYPDSFRLTTLDVSNCPNLTTLNFHCQKSLQSISGLERCGELRHLALYWCTALDDNFVGAQLNPIPNEAIEIACRGSNLVITALEDLEAQLAPDGRWGQFLRQHPHCSIFRLLEIDGDVTKKLTCERLLAPHGFQLKENNFGANKYCYRITALNA